MFSFFNKKSKKSKNSYSLDEEIYPYENHISRSHFNCCVIRAPDLDDYYDKYLTPNYMDISPNKDVPCEFNPNLDPALDLDDDCDDYSIPIRQNENVFNVAPKAMASTSSTSGNVLSAQYSSAVSLPTSWNIRRGQTTKATEPCGIPSGIANSSQSSNEQWHGQRNQELRIQAVQMSEEIQVDQGPKTMCNLETYVRKIMDDARMAPSKYEYRQSLIKKLYAIHKEIERKKLKRNSGVLLRDSFNNLCSHLGWNSIGSLAREDSTIINNVQWALEKGIHHWLTESSHQRIEINLHLSRSVHQGLSKIIFYENSIIHKTPPFGNEVRFLPISINLTEMFEGDNLSIRIPANTSLQNQIKLNECTRRKLELLQGIAPKYWLKMIKDHIMRDQIRDNIEIYAKIVRREMYEMAKSESEYLHLLCVKYYIFRKDVYKRMWKKEDELCLSNVNVPLLKIVENRLCNAQVSGASNIPLSSAVISSQSTDKEWYELFNQVLREHMIRKIILTIRASQQIREDQDPKLNRPVGIMIGNKIKIIDNVLQYVIKKEREIAEEAKTESEYYNSLADLYYDIKKDLDKQKQRGEEQTSWLQLQNDS